MSKLEWLRSLVEEVNQKHQQQTRPLSSMQEPSLQSRSLRNQSIQNKQAEHNEQFDPELPESGELEVIYNRGLRGIIEPSKAYRHIQIHEAKPYAFYETYPTFERLNLNQLQWYLYWRKLVQTGIYTDAREGYLFLYAFELLNLSFEPDPQKATEMLIELYEGYKERIPRIATIMPAWIGDMYAEFEKTEMAISWYEKTTPQQYDTAVFETYERIGAVPPFSVWKPLISEQTAFYRKHMEELDMCYAMLMEPLNKYFLKKRKKTLLEVILPEKWVIEHARFYDWAVMERSVPSRRKISYSPRYRGRGSTLDILVACLRYMENHFREEAGNRLLKVNGSLLTKPLKALLDQVFELFRALHPRLQPVKSVKSFKEKKRIPKPSTKLELETGAIHIDPSLVETLHDESDWVRDTILAILEPSEPDEIKGEDGQKEAGIIIDEAANEGLLADDQLLIVLDEDEKSSNKQDNESRLQGNMAQVNSESDLHQIFAPITIRNELEVSWQDFLQTLTEVEQTLIAWWLSRPVLHKSVQEIQDFFRIRGIMMHPVLDAVNEKALDELGDLLFEVVMDEVYWNEEFAAIVNG